MSFPLAQFDGKQETARKYVIGEDAGNSMDPFLGHVFEDAQSHGALR
jgi:hypothetical protein